MEGTAGRQTSIVALMSVFGLGIAFVIVGAISVEYAKALQIANIGDLTLALFLTSSIVQLVIGPLVDRFGYRPLAIAGFLVSGLSMCLLAVATGFQMALIACILLGVGAMCMNTVGNTLIPVVLFGGKDPARASNFGNAFFGLGLVVTPLLFSVMTYKPGLFVLARRVPGLPGDGVRHAVPARGQRVPVLHGGQAARQSRGAGRRAGAVLLHLARVEHEHVEQALHDRAARRGPEPQRRRQRQPRPEPVRRGDDGRAVPHVDGEEPDEHRREAHRRARRSWRSAPS